MPFCKITFYERLSDESLFVKTLFIKKAKCLHPSGLALLCFCLHYSKMIEKKCVSDYVLLSTIYSSHNRLRCNLFLDLCTVCSLFLKWKLLIFVSLLISWLLLQSFLCSLFISVFIFFNLFLKDFLALFFFFLIWTFSKVFIKLVTILFLFYVLAPFGCEA